MIIGPRSADILGILHTTMLRVYREQSESDCINDHQDKNIMLMSQENDQSVLKWYRENSKTNKNL